MSRRHGGFNADALTVGLFRRFGISFLALLIFIFFIFEYNFNPADIYNRLLQIQAIPVVAQPFSDLAAVLQAVGCAHQGVNVYQPSACMQGGVYNYSPLVLKFIFLQPAAAHLMLWGITLAVAFLLSLACLPPPRTRAEFYLRTAATISPATVFLLERANFDALIFLIILLSTLLSLRGPLLRLAAYLLFFLAAAIKYFPLTLLALALRESASRLFALVAGFGTLGLFFLLHFGHGTLAAINIIPRAGPLGNAFGAINLPFGLSYLFFPPAAIGPGALAAYRMPVFFDLAFAALVLWAMFQAIARGKTYAPAMRALAPPPLMFLLSGSIVIITCFFIAQNIIYRDVFLLLTLPGIFDLARAAATPARTTLHWLAAAILFIMWEEFFRTQFIWLTSHTLPTPLAEGLVMLFWLGREFVWWWVIIQMSALIICFLRASLSWLPGLRQNA